MRCMTIKNQQCFSRLHIYVEDIPPNQFKKSTFCNQDCESSTEDNRSGPSPAMRVDESDPDFILLPSYCNKQAEDGQTFLAEQNLAFRGCNNNLFQKNNVCVRYVKLKNTGASVEERFLTFCPVNDATGEGRKLQLENYGLDIHNLRGQGYDNGSNMK
ncbi:hypothetical protein YQE_00270, partial [Dendroctonus ponderosae]